MEIEVKFKEKWAEIGIILGLSLLVWLLGEKITYPPLARLAGLTTLVLLLGVYSLRIKEKEEISE